MNIGVDFGGVLSVHGNKNTDGKEHRNDEIDMPDAIESLKFLKSLGHKLYIVSFCGKARAVGTKKSIEETLPNLFEGVYFVKDREYKKYICDYLDIDVMIDDTLTILEDIKQYILNISIILFDGPEVKTWKNTIDAIDIITTNKNWNSTIVIDKLPISKYIHNV